MEADIAAKEKARAGRGSGVAVAVASASTSGSGTTARTTTTTAKRLDRMEADVAAKARAKASRTAGSGSSITTIKRLNRMEEDVTTKAKAKAGRASMTGSSSKNKNNNNNNDAIAKKLSKAGVARNHQATRPGAVSSNDAGSNANAIIEKKKKNNKGSMGGALGVSTTSDRLAAAKKSSEAAATTYAVGGEKQDLSKYNKNNGGGQGGDGLLDIELPGGDDKDDGDRLAVAVAVNEDDYENVFIPSAVEYDPDAKLPMYKNQRLRVYSLLSCTLLIIIAACSIGVLAILEGNEEQYVAPSESPTCSRCTMDFVEQLELEVGSQKLNDPTKAEYKAKEWIIHEDDMEMLSTDRNFIQRFLLAAFYFDTHQIADWRSCNQQSLDIADAETGVCDFLKVSNIDPLEFESCK